MYCPEVLIDFPAGQKGKEKEARKKIP